MTPAPVVSALAEQPAYYALYALYADYQRNNAFHLEREYFDRLREMVRFIQPLRGLVQPDMKSWSLRLFTERQALARFSPEVASAAWRLVRQVVDEIGPPRQVPRRLESDGTAKPSPEATAQPPRKPATRHDEPSFPRSPVDYRFAV
jgi:hypothetical protein